MNRKIITVNALNGLKEDFLNSLKSYVVVTSDYDDTFIEKTGKYCQRLLMFKALCESMSVKFIIVTSREQLKFDPPTQKPWDDLVDYVSTLGVVPYAIVYNAGDKSTILKQLNAVCHFEDDILTAQKCLKEGIPVWYTGEYLDPEYQDKWLDAVGKEIKYYPEHSVCRLQTLKTIGNLI